MHFALGIPLRFDLSFAVFDCYSHFVSVCLRGVSEKEFD